MRGHDVACAEEDFFAGVMWERQDGGGCGGFRGWDSHCGGGGGGGGGNCGGGDEEVGGRSRYRCIRTVSFQTPSTLTFLLARVYSALDSNPIRTLA